MENHLVTHNVYPICQAVHTNLFDDCY